jgi:hypothetical protein
MTRLVRGVQPATSLPTQGADQPGPLLLFLPTMPPTRVLPHVFPAQAIQPGQAQKPGRPDNAAEGKERRERKDIGQHHFLSTPRYRDRDPRTSPLTCVR